MRLASFTLFLLAFFSLQFMVGDASASDVSAYARNKIDSVVSVVNGRESNLNKTLKIERIVMDLMDYDTFFDMTLPKNSWQNLKKDGLGDKIINKYNGKYVNEYFKQITDCSTLNIEFSDNEDKKSKTTVVSGEYKCSSSDKKSLSLSLSNSTKRVLNVSINNISFIKNQKDEFNQELSGKSYEEIKNFLLKN